MIDDDYGAGALDAVELARLLVEAERLLGGDLDAVQRRIERVWCELLYVSGETIEEEGEQAMFSNGNENRARKRLRDAEGQVAEVDAGLARAEAEVARWRQAGQEARRAVDEARVAVLVDHAVVVAERARARRADAARAGSTVEDVEMVSMTAGGTTRTLERRYVRDRINGEAAQLEEQARSLEASAASYRSVLLAEPPVPEAEPVFRSGDARESWRSDQVRKAARREASVAGQRESLGAAVAAIVEEGSTS